MSRPPSPAASAPGEHLRVAPQAIPLSLTSFVGREEDIARVIALLDEPHVRLLTLTGPGGVGKTRLAIEVARRIATDFADGVVVVRLATLSDASLAPASVARAIGARGGREDIAAWLEGKHLLLVLDDLEHLLDPAPVWLAELLGHCPRLKVLVTSQAALNIGGEHRYLVPPLSVPESDAGAVGADAEAVVLFAQRARALRPDFTLDERTLTAVTRIVREVDGLPLAIELAASRVMLLTPTEIAAHLTHRLQLLSGGLRDMPERRRSLRATLDWSYDLLSSDEQRLFCQLAVFVGGFDLAAAEAVVSPDAFDAVTGIASLVDKSLLRVVVPEGATEARYVMLETLREYGLERLAASGEEAAVRDRHAGWFASLVERFSPGRHLGRPADPADVARIEMDYGNVRAALAWLDAAHREHDLLRLATLLRGYWYLTERFAEALRWYERVQSDDVSTQADLLRMKGQMAQLLGRPDAPQLLEQSLSLAQQGGNWFQIARALFNLGILFEDRGDYDDANARFHTAREMFETHADHVSVLECTYHLGVVAYGLGRLDAASSDLAAAVAAASAMGDQQLATWGDTYRILVACEQHDVDTAVALMRRHVSMLNVPSLRHHMQEFLSAAGVIAAERAQYTLAARLLGAASRSGYPFMLPERRAFQHAETIARRHLGDEEFERTRALGRRLSNTEVAADLGQLLSGAERPSRPPAPREAHDLTPRELDVLRLLADGLSNQEIADALFVSRRTVATHVDHILAKLDVRSRTAAVAWAVRGGLA